MSKIRYRDKSFKPEALARIGQMQAIVDEYAAQDLQLTARQLFYQFVSRDLVPNTVNSYKNLTALLTDARYAGLVDWDAIEDRGREPTTWRDFENLSEAVEDAVRSYRLPRWRGQRHYAELWVEKQALAGVLEPLAAEFHVTLCVNKGYSSASAMYRAARRFRLYGANYNKQLSLFYLGDHDPSGEDMVRDIGDRLREFGVRGLEVTKLALTMAQVREHNPPPNPAKTTDSRFGRYAARYGDESWEVDALPPNVLQRLIREAFEAIVDEAALEEVIEQERRDKERLRAACAEVE